jgi:hypothetical protein
MWLATSGCTQAQSLTNIPKRFKEQTSAKRKKDNHFRILINPEPSRWRKPRLTTVIP